MDEKPIKREDSASLRDTTQSSKKEQVRRVKKEDKKPTGQQGKE